MQENLPIRKKLRIKDYDYSKENIFFITICTQDKLKLLGRITDGSYIELTQEGKIAKRNICKIEKIYDNVTIHESIIMPNHIHILLEMKYKEGITISKIIKHYKTNVSREITRSIWQKSFYEHVVRDEKEYWKIVQYIQENVMNWKHDKYF